MVTTSLTSRCSWCREGTVDTAEILNTPKVTIRLCAQCAQKWALLLRVGGGLARSMQSKKRGRL